MNTHHFKTMEQKRTPIINFFQCDCIDFMKSKPDKCYDLAIVDPPYGIGISLNPVRQQQRFF